METQTLTGKPPEPVNFRAERVGRLVICNWVGPSNLASIEYGRSACKHLVDTSPLEGRMSCITLVRAPQKVATRKELDGFTAWSKELRQQFARIYFVLEYDAEGVSGALLKMFIEATMYLVCGSGFSAYARTAEEAIRQSCLELGLPANEMLEKAVALGLMNPIPLRRTEVAH